MMLRSAPGRTWTLGLVSLALAAAAPALAGQDQLAVRAGRILPVVGDPIENGVILIEDGRISAVGGADLRIPSRARVVDASDKVVIPGIVDVHSSRGMDSANEDNPEVPFATVLDSIDPSHEFFKDSLRNGVTSIAVVPGNNTMIGGQAAVVKPVGLMIEDMILRRSAGLKIALRPTGNRSRMSQMAALRRSLNDVRDYISTELEERGDSDEAAQPDIRREAMVRLLRGEIPAFLYCERAMDVRHALELVNEFRLKGILVLDGECYKAVDRVAASGLPVVIGPQLAYWQTHPVTDEDEYITLPSIYAGAGIKPTFQVTGAGGGSLLGANFHWYQAATNVRHGAPAAEALESITIRPARQLGVDSLVGSIEVGKDADLVILSGEPLELGTWVEKVIVNGRIAYDRAEDAMIRDLLNPKTNSAVDGAEK